MTSLEEGTARAAGAHLIEYVVVPFAAALLHHARLLQKIGVKSGAAEGPVPVETELDVLSESTRVVVADCLSIPKGLADTSNSIITGTNAGTNAGTNLQERVARQHAALQGLVPLPAGSCDVSEVAHNVAGGYGLACARLAGYDDALVAALLSHAPARLLCHREHVRVHAAPRRQLGVREGKFPRVEREILVRVDCYEHDA